MSFDFQVARYMHSQMPGCALVKFLSLDSETNICEMPKIEKHQVNSMAYSRYTYT